jgi:hypothetical protein
MAKVDLATATLTASRPDSTPEQLLQLVGASDKVDRLLAKHPVASSGLLDRLSHSSDKTTRRHVVVNANASKEVLLRLAPQFPGDFFKNPSFDWLLLEDPDLLKNLGRGVLKNILKRTECPESFLRWAADKGSDQEKLAVAMNPQTPKGILQSMVLVGGESGEVAGAHEKLQTDAQPVDPAAVLRKAVSDALNAMGAADASLCWTRGFIGPAQWTCLNPMVRLRVLKLSTLPFVESWLQIGDPSLIKSGDIEFLAAIARSEMTAPQLLKELSKHKDVFIRETVAENKNAPPDVLYALTGDSELRVRQCIAGNPSSSAASMAVLIDDSDKWVRHRVLQRRDITETLLSLMADSVHDDVRSSIAERQDTSQATLEKLSGDKAQVVRLAVARNVASSLRILEELANDEDVDVKAGVVRNPVTPELLCASTLRTLAEHTSGAMKMFVVDHALTPLQLRIDVLEALAKSSESRGRQFAAKHRSTSGNALQILSSDQDGGIRGDVALHPKTPTDVLEAMTKDTNSTVRWKLAQNAALSAKGLVDLAVDSDYEVRMKVAGHLGTPLAQLEVLATDVNPYVCSAVAGNNNASAALLAALSGADNSEFRIGVARNSAAPVAILEHLAKDISAGVRAAVASNRAAPHFLLEVLAVDSGARVRAALAANAEISVELLKDLANDTDPDVLRAVSKNERAPQDVKFLVLKALIMGKSNSGRWLRDELARDPNTSVELLDLIAKKRGVGAASDLQAASDPLTPVAKLEKLALSKKSVIQLAVAANPSTTTVVRVQLWGALAEKSGLADFQGFAEGYDIPPEFRHRAIQLKNARVWWHEMELLAKRHRSVPLPDRPDADALIRMFNAEAENLLLNPQRSMAAQLMGVTQLSLLTMTPIAVERACTRPLHITTEGVRQLHPVRLLGLSSPSVLIEALVKRYRSVDWVERLAVAANLNTPSNLLTSLKKDAHRAVSLQAHHTEAMKEALRNWQQAVIEIPEPWIQQTLSLVAEVHNIDVNAVTMSDQVGQLQTATTELLALSEKWRLQTVESRTLASEVAYFIDDNLPDEDQQMFEIVDANWKRSFRLSAKKPLVEITIPTPCPKCAGLVKQSIDTFSCVGLNDAAKGCGFSIPRTIFQRELSVEEVTRLLQKERISSFKGKNARTGRPVTVAFHLEYDNSLENWKLQSDF